MAKLYYSNEDLQKDLSEITRQIAVSGWKPDVVIGPGRGAFVMGVMLSHYYEVPFHGFEWQTRDHEMIKESTRLETILSKYSMQNILLVDDINDSGKTLKIIYDLNNPSKIIYNATLIYNQESKVKTHFYGKMIKRSEDKNWYVFPWEEW